MAGDVTFDDYIQNHLAIPRKGMKNDDFATEYQGKMAAANAAIAALRNYPLNAAMTQDSNAPINFTSTLGEGVAGEYTPSKNQIEIALNRNVGDMRNTAYHETLHSLQRNGAREGYDFLRRAPISPGSVMNDYTKPAVPGYEGSPRDFVKALDEANMNYGTGEPAAFMGAGLNQPMKLDPQVRAVAAQFPGQSGMFAQQTSQPNRPVPKHYRGYPEMNLLEKGLYNLNMLPDAAAILPEEARYSAMQQQVLRRLNDETNPRDRH